MRLIEKNGGNGMALNLNFCRNCGSPLHTEGGRIPDCCPRCGLSLSAQELTDLHDSAVSDQERLELQTQRQSKRRKWYVLLAVWAVAELMLWLQCHFIGGAYIPLFAVLAIILGLGGAYLLACNFPEIPGVEKSRNIKAVTGALFGCWMLVCMAVLIVLPERGGSGMFPSENAGASEGGAYQTGAEQNYSGAETAGNIICWYDFLGADAYTYPDSFSEEISLPEWSGTRLIWRKYQVCASRDGVEHALVTGYPVRNVYFADLNADGVRELCATVQFGSDEAPDLHVEVYDLAHDANWQLWEHGGAQYTLSLENGPYLGGRMLCVRRSLGGMNYGSQLCGLTLGDKGLSLNENI